MKRPWCSLAHPGSEKKAGAGSLRELGVFLKTRTCRDKDWQTTGRERGRMEWRGKGYEAQRVREGIRSKIRGQKTK